MFVSYDDFLFESKSESCLKKAIKLMTKNSELVEVLQGCVDGVYPKIQVTYTQGAKSYVVVATNSGTPESTLFKTTDPKKALLAMIILNTKREDADDIMGMIKVKDVLVEYSVFPGNRKLSDEEMKARYNLMYSEFSDFLPVFTGTPIVKKF